MWSKQMRLLLTTIILTITVLLAGCDDGYNFDKYSKYKADGELSDAVHEWIADYIENYCTANRDGSISCR
tara:strand:+ start:171 stop:380 length:210 start_codon:yes stop_codon:yes gene_type:complete